MEKRCGKLTEIVTIMTKYFYCYFLSEQGKREMAGGFKADWKVCTRGLTCYGVFPR